MSAKWIGIVIGSLLGAAFLGISIQMIGNPTLTSSENVTTSPVANKVPEQLIPSSSTQPNSNESAPQEAVLVLSSQTTPLPEQPSP